jgi:adenine-specific DNA-methyltransferase
MFAGSCTTGEAVVRLNLLDNGQRRFVCCQIPEICPDDTAAFRAGFTTIADIGRTRLRRVMEAVRQEAGLMSDTLIGFGFKSFLLAPSNFKQWRGDGIEDPDALAEQLQMFVRGEKPGAAPEDMLFELLLKFGQPLTVPIEKLAIGGATVYAINNRAMVFILEGFTLDMIEPLLALKPGEVVAIDSVFHDSDELKTNLDLQCRDAEVRFTCI